MPAPERRTTADLIAAAAIALTVVVVAGLIWHYSQERATVSQTAAVDSAPAPHASAVPDAVHELWHAADAATSVPVVAGPVVVTADGDAVIGRDSRTGKQRWRYQRNLPLCGVQSSWGTVVAVYRDSRGCSQATELAATTGARVTARSSMADSNVALRGDNSYIVSRGPRRLEVWRSDLVRTVEYGYVDAPVNPNSQPRSKCTLLDSTLSTAGSRLVVLEKCPGDSDARLTLLNSVPKDAQKPEEYASSVLPDTTANTPDPRLLASSGDTTALYLPGDATNPPRIGVYDSSIKTIAQYPLPAPLPADAEVTRVGYYFMLWTGHSVMALDPATLAPKWTTDPGIDAAGPGTIMADHVLIPTAEGIAVVNAVDGSQERSIPVSRNGYHGRIDSAALGSTIVEQRGKDVYALG